jgi:hypothetical protein
MLQTSSTTGNVIVTFTARSTSVPGQPCHLCWRRHRKWRSIAECVWPRAIWIAGNPPNRGPCYALESRCHPGCTVTLWDDLEEAAAAKRMIDRLHCGSRCCRQHTIYRLGGN